MSIIPFLVFQQLQRQHDDRMRRMREDDERRKRREADEEEYRRQRNADNLD